MLKNLKYIYFLLPFICLQFSSHASENVIDSENKQVHEFIANKLGQIGWFYWTPDQAIGMTNWLDQISTYNQMAHRASFLWRSRSEYVFPDGVMLGINSAAELQSQMFKRPQADYLQTYGMLLLPKAQQGGQPVKLVLDIPNQFREAYIFFLNNNGKFERIQDYNTPMLPPSHADFFVTKQFVNLRQQQWAFETNGQPYQKLTLRDNLLAPSVQFAHALSFASIYSTVRETGLYIIHKSLAALQDTLYVWPTEVGHNLLVASGCGDLYDYIQSLYQKRLVSQQSQTHTLPKAIRLFLSAQNDQQYHRAYFLPIDPALLTQLTQLDFHIQEAGGFVPLDLTMREIRLGEFVGKLYNTNITPQFRTVLKFNNQTNTQRFLVAFNQYLQRNPAIYQQVTNMKGYFGSRNAIVGHDSVVIYHTLANTSDQIAAFVQEQSFTNQLLDSLPFIFKRVAPGIGLAPQSGTESYTKLLSRQIAHTFIGIESLDVDPEVKKRLFTEQATRHILFD